MHRLEEIADRIRQSFDARTAARDQALAQTRLLTRHCANAIRAVHREEYDVARQHLDEARSMVQTLRSDLAEKYPDLYYSGYTQDAFKEFAEASIVFSLVQSDILPQPEDLNLDYTVYLQGMAEAAGEMRRRCLDLLRNDHSTDAERLLDYMDEIYTVLVTMDYPDAVTGGLRRLTDLVRGVTERTRGDMTISLRQQQLEQSLQRLEGKISRAA